ncbi:MAG TPA: sigma-70 family RNA polymerase sigma factor [Solirubrobacteraceae bacterium]|jgi:RNA polymerase sigma factor (sigma-70 family)|nr:sigma-70 family RNA polymerase sigma factor [Solirubrobacteraceae bacterium]
MSPSRLSRYRAERLLRKDFAGLRAKVLAIVRGQLLAKGIALDPADLEACYAQAWHGLYATVSEGEEVENPSAWLVLVTFRRAIDEYRSATRAGVVDGGENSSYPSRFDASSTDLASELDDRARLRHVFEALRSRLSARECEAASLCYLQGLSRAEAAARMGISEARMGKLMEGSGSGRLGVAGKVGELLETIKAGGWCEQQSSLMRAYAFGILDPDGERHALAMAHCRECPACRAHVASLRGLASVLPLPLLPRLAAAGGSAATAAAGTRVAFGGAANGGWSGVAGSLTAKLAVTAIVVVGAGYAVLGGHAHASQTGHAARLAQAPSPASSATAVLPQAPFALSPVRTRGARTRPRQSPAKRRHQRSARIHGKADVEAAAREFGPERIGPAPAPPAAPTTSSQAGEFGFE